MRLISAGGLHGKGFGGHADSVFNEKQGRNHGNHYCMLKLVFFKVLSHTDTVHVAEDASGSAFIRYPGADEIVTGSPQNSAYMYIININVGLAFGLTLVSDKTDALLSISC